MENGHPSTRAVNSGFSTFTNLLIPTLNWLPYFTITTYVTPTTARNLLQLFHFSRTSVQSQFCIQQFLEEEGTGERAEEIATEIRANKIAALRNLAAEMTYKL